MVAESLPAVVFFLCSETFLLLFCIEILLAKPEQACKYHKFNLVSSPLDYAEVLAALMSWIIALKADNCLAWHTLFMLYSLLQFFSSVKANINLQWVLKMRFVILLPLNQARHCSAWSTPDTVRRVPTALINRLHFISTLVFCQVMTELIKEFCTSLQCLASSHSFWWKGWLSHTVAQLATCLLIARWDCSAFLSFPLFGVEQPKSQQPMHAVPAGTGTRSDVTEPVGAQKLGAD